MHFQTDIGVGIRQAIIPVFAYFAAAILYSIVRHNTKNAKHLEVTLKYFNWLKIKDTFRAYGSLRQVK